MGLLIEALSLEKIWGLGKPFIQYYHKASSVELFLVGATLCYVLYQLFIDARTPATQNNLALPPLAGYSLPIVGHLPYLLYDSNSFLDWGTENYGDVWDMNILGTLITIASGASGLQCIKAEEHILSLQDGFVHDVMHMQYAFEPRISQIGMTIFPKLTRSTLGPGKMNNYYDDVVKSFGIGLKEIDTGDRIVINTPTHTIQRLVSYMNVRSLVGEEVALDPQLIATFTDYTQDLVKVMGLYVATPTWVHQFIIPFVKAYKHHRQVMIDRIIPLVRAKRASTAQGITAPETLMQAFIDYKEPSDGAELTEYEISQTILMVAFASVHTTSLNLGFALAWIMARPDLCKRLEDEIVEAFGNGPVTKDRLDQMQFLDKFLHEVYSQGADKLGIGKRAVQDYTFVNGCQVPKGRLIETTNRAMCVGFNKSRSTVEEMDPDVWGNRKPTNSKNDYVVFGVGKHTCPGRFFATLEVKVALVTMLRKYTVTSLDGKPYRPVKHLLGVIATVPETPFVLTKREKLLGH